MDAPDDDQDVALQRVSGDLLADFDRSLPGYLHNRDRDDQVRVGETTRLTSTLLDPFQEFPQLLDPHLSSWLPRLADAYLAALQLQRRHNLHHLHNHHETSQDHHDPPSPAAARLLEPLATGICKLLYTFCKVRGEKVVVRFLAVEAKHLEVLLAAFEESHAAWAWEERYVVLLWLSHLALAPFDLASMSSLDLDEAALPEIARFEWPGNLPSIAARIVPLAVRYLASPGKERDAAKALLVRLAVRRDMQELGLLRQLVRWALASLKQPLQHQSEAEVLRTKTAYFYIGVLAFLAGVVESVPDVSDIAHAVQDLPAAVSSSALARKMTIKVMRSAAVVLLRNPDRGIEAADILERTIGYLLEAAADNDTPVRFAASKALSVVTLRLDPDMAVEVVEAVLEGLNRNVLWTRAPSSEEEGGEDQVRDLAAVDPLEWHGLTLTLAHLLYRRSPPAEILPEAVQALLLGLSFERRGTSGGSVGTNVRDAACFGIWALARRYTTSELLAVRPKSPTASTNTTTTSSSSSSTSPPSTLQLLATELVAAACLDSAGNIRRGASAALQELIGRHPNTVEHGIRVVQAVDYHAVALRTRAIHDVALAATRLSGVYGDALLGGLLRWRGVGDPDVGVRRAAGAAFGAIVAEMAGSGNNGGGGGGDDGSDGFNHFENMLAVLRRERKGLQTRQVDELHGLLLMLSSVLDQLATRPPSNKTQQQRYESLISVAMADVASIITTCTTTTYRKPDLVAEAASRLIVSSLPILLSSSPPSPNTTRAIMQITSALEPLLPSWLLSHDKDTIAAVSEASHALLVLSTPPDRHRILEAWAAVVLQPRRGYSNDAQDTGYFFALVAGVRRASPSLEPTPDADLVCDALRDRWTADRSVDTRVAILQALTPSSLLKLRPLAFLDLVRQGLNDYTVTARGDVGSLVRLAALSATRALWADLLLLPLDSQPASPDTHHLPAAISALFLDVLRLASEKLDRVRAEAQTTLSLGLAPSARQSFLALSNSSPAYFSYLLSLAQQPPPSSSPLHPSVLSCAALQTSPLPWTEALLSGLVISADSGSEDLVISARDALCASAQLSPHHLRTICAGLVGNLRRRLAPHPQPQPQQPPARDADRVLIPTLQILAFLISINLFPLWDGTNPNPDDSTPSIKKTTLKTICLLAQKAAYKSGNMRKITACIRLYGAIASLPAITDSAPGVLEAKKRLGALLFHPWPKVRSLVVDELWGALGMFAGAGGGDEHERGGGDGDGCGGRDKSELLKGVDWGKAGKETVRAAVRELGLE